MALLGGQSQFSRCPISWIVKYSFASADLYAGGVQMGVQ